MQNMNHQENISYIYYNLPWARKCVIKKINDEIAGVDIRFQINRIYKAERELLNLLKKRNDIKEDIITATSIRINDKKHAKVIYEKVDNFKEFIEYITENVKENKLNAKLMRGRHKWFWAITD